MESIASIECPTILFINKIDRVGADASGVLKEIHKELTKDVVVFHKVSDEGSMDVDFTEFIADAVISNDSKQGLSDQLPEEFIESVLNNDESLLEQYLETDNLQFSDLLISLKRQVQESKIFPVLFGSAKLDLGISELMDAIVEYMPVAAGDSTALVSGIVYKVEHDTTMGRVAHIRLFNGSLRNRDVVLNASQNKEGKISQILKPVAQKFENTGEVLAGDTAAICGLNTIRAGDTLGVSTGLEEKLSLHIPLLTVRIVPRDSSEHSALVDALKILSDEDPTLDLSWLKDERELHIKAMGLIQLEILESILSGRFGLSVSFSEPSIIYKETPAISGEGYEEYTMPKPCWAVVRFKIEPAEPGSGVSYQSQVGVNTIARRYQQEIERSIPVALKQGIMGWEVTDLKITLIAGEHHNIHSRAGDFVIATPMAILKGLKETGSTLLEPLLSFNISGPEEHLGKVIGSLTQLRAELGNPEILDDKFELSGTVPVATSLDYAARFSALTGGKGKLSTHFAGYRECPQELGATTPFRGISPLDRAKYILKARKAIQ